MQEAGRALIIKGSDRFTFVSFHNRDVKYAFQLSNLLLRYYRKVWLDRFEISPTEDWDAKMSQTRETAADAIVIVSDDYLGSAYCRSEYEAFQQREINIAAVVCRDFSTEAIADFTFDDWIDLRRWFESPDDHSVEYLLSRIRQSESVQQSEGLDYLRHFIETLELELSQMPTSRALLAKAARQESADARPRAWQSSMLRNWDFADGQSGDDVKDLLAWSQGKRQFMLCGEAGSGKTVLARLLALEAAHAAMRDDDAPLPIWLDLMKWQDEHESVEAYIESQWLLVSYWKHWLASKQALFMLDDWDDLAALRPGAAAELADWMAANAGHRFVVLSRHAQNVPSDLPALHIQPMSGQLALKFSSGFLTLEQQNTFRQIIRSQPALIENSYVDYLALGIELLAADKRLAVKAWHRNPLPALISQRQAEAELESGDLLKSLQTLAGQMMQRERYRFVPRAEIEAGGEVIDAALDIGLLSEVGGQLRFQAEIFQRYLAMDSLRKDGLDKRLQAPQFTERGERLAQKWDKPAIILVDASAADKRPDIIREIADIDPWLASMCLQRHTELYGDCQEMLVNRLIELAVQEPRARGGLRAILHDIPNPNKTITALAGGIAGFDDEMRRWLWHELLALPIQLPAAFVNIVANLSRVGTAAADLLDVCPLPFAATYLAKLSQQENEGIRANAIWLLGEMKYAPAAVFLLDCLDDTTAPLKELALALLKYADAAIYARLLHWLQNNPTQTEPIASAMNQRRHIVSGRLLVMAQEKQLTLQPQMTEIMANLDESELAIGLAMLASQFVDLPTALHQTIAARENADELQKQVAAGIRHLPHREGLQELLDDIVRIMQDPPKAMTHSDLVREMPPAPMPDDDVEDGIPAELLAELYDDDRQAQRTALRRLVDEHRGAALPILLEMAGADEAPVRLAACEGLADFVDEDAACQALVAALSDADKDVIAAATESLKTAQSVDYAELMRLLDSDSAPTVAAAARILREAPARRVEESRPADMDAGNDTAADATDDNAETVQTEGLPTFTDEEKILRTLGLLRHDDWGKTQKAAKFLRRFARHLRGSDSPHILRLLCDALSDRSWHVRWAAAEALAFFGHADAIPALRERLNDVNWIVQVAVIRSLVELDAKDSATAMTPLLKSPHKSVREAAAEALGALQNPDVIPALGQALQSDPDYFVRFAAIQSIHQISPDGAREYLNDALQDRYIHVRWYAMKVLAPQMDAADIPLLARLAADRGKPLWEEKSIKDFAILALQRIDTPESKALLKTIRTGEKQNDL